MAINGTVADFERQKFVESESRPGLAAVDVNGSTKILGANGEDLTTSLDGKSYLNLLSEWPFLAVDNNISASYPSATRETYEFRRDLTVVMTIQVDYTDSTKDVLSEVRRIV